MKARKFEEQETRVESGPIQFGSDWPGVFFRGDSAMHYSMILGLLLDHTGPLEGFNRMYVEFLRRELAACNEFTLEKD